MIARTLALSAFVATGCASGPAADPAVADVEAVVRALYAELSAREWDALAARFAPDARLTMARRGRVDALAAPDFIAKNREALKGVAVFEEKCVALDVRVHGAVAHAWSRFEGKVGSPEKLRTWGGIDAWTLVRIDGAWRVAAVAVAADE
jgi:hypothetical protein